MMVFRQIRRIAKRLEQLNVQDGESGSRAEPHALRLRRARALSRMVANWKVSGCCKDTAVIVAQDCTAPACNSARRKERSDA